MRNRLSPSPVPPSLLAAIGIAALALSSAPPAAAQNREAFQPPRRSYEMDIVRRTLNHLDRAGTPWIGRGASNHASAARRDLIRFQDHWQHGRFDADRMDSALAHLDHIVHSSQAPPQWREMLQRDVYDLRGFRTRAFRH